MLAALALIGCAKRRNDPKSPKASQNHPEPARIIQNQPESLRITQNQLESPNNINSLMTIKSTCSVADLQGCKPSTLPITQDQRMVRLILMIKNKQRNINENNKRQKQQRKSNQQLKNNSCFVNVIKCLSISFISWLGQLLPRCARGFHSASYFNLYSGMPTKNLYNLSFQMKVYSKTNRLQEYSKTQR